MQNDQNSQTKSKKGILDKKNDIVCILKYDIKVLFKVFLKLKIYLREVEFMKLLMKKHSIIVVETQNHP